MKRLLCIIGGMNAGGAETQLMKIYRQLDRTKYQLDFAVSIDNKGAYDDEIYSMGGKIHHITPKSMGFIKNFCSIKKIVAENNYKYVLRVSQHSLSALELFAAHMGGAKTRAFRSSNSNTGTGNGSGLIMHKVCMFMPKFFANVRLAPSTEAAEFMFGRHCIKKNKAYLLHNALRVEDFTYNEDKRYKIRQEFCIEDNFVVGHIGRFHKQKNHAYLIDIFREICKIRSDAMLLLIGKGEQEDQIVNLAKKYGLDDKVIFAGVRSDVPDMLSAMDVFVFPSFYEGMPNTVIEAQANGLHCIVADTITREADITGLVEYLPLTCSPNEWANRTISVNTVHHDQTENFIQNRYDIDSVVHDFTNLVFNESEEPS